MRQQRPGFHADRMMRDRIARRLMVMGLNPSMKERVEEVSMAAHAANEASARGRRYAASGLDSILAAKVTTPDVPHWAVPRPRITKLIAEGTLWCPLTVITGPPGTGKTMALALWAATEPGPVAWVCLDHLDNQSAVFWSHVVAALR